MAIPAHPSGAIAASSTRRVAPLSRPIGAIDMLDLRLQRADLAPLRDAYLTGWLGMAGMSQLQFSGSADAACIWPRGRSALFDLAVAMASTITDPRSTLRLHRAGR